MKVSGVISLQGGPLRSLEMELLSYNPYNCITPGKPIYKAIYMGYFTPFTTGSRAHLASLNFAVGVRLGDNALDSVFVPKVTAFAVEFF